MPTNISKHEERVAIVATNVMLEGNLMLYLRRTKSSEREPGKWNIPSGGVRMGEELRTAALREVREETGRPFEPQQIKELGDAQVSIAAKDGSEFTMRCYTFIIDARDSMSLKDVKLARKEHSAKAGLSLADLKYQLHLIQTENRLVDRAVEKVEEIRGRRHLDLTGADKINILLNYDKIARVKRHGIDAIEDDAYGSEGASVAQEAAASGQ